MALEIILGFIYSSILEWWLHKVPLHKSFLFKNHIEHHKLTGRDMFDPDYFNSLFGSGETIFAIFIAVLHIPLLLWLKYFYITFFCYLISYLIVHRLSHTNIIFAKRYVPWHYIHHCVNAKKNFGIVHPIIDIIFGTYKKL